MDLLIALGFMFGVPLGIILIIASFAVTNNLSDFLQILLCGVLSLTIGLICWQLEKESWKK